MTHVHRSRWMLALGLTAMATAVMNALPATVAGSVAELVGSGAVSLGSMLVCGFCIGAGALMIATDTWVGFLTKSSSWKLLATCGAACAAAVM